jgi:PTH1 family peptidyl-tRNA hydrolase
VTQQAAQTHTFDLAKIKLIVGLGNPGPRYSKTRHNAGFMLMDTLHELYGSGAWDTRGNAHSSTISVTLKDGSFHSITLIKPMMGMNVSGVQIKAFVKNGITSDNVLICYDELEKPFGKNMLRFAGSARGHNGVRSAIEQIGNNFWQLRLGIDRPAEKKDVADYVLSNFTPSEMQSMDTSQEAALKLLGL